jgi:hypothetical protein
VGRWRGSSPTDQNRSSDQALPAQRVRKAHLRTPDFERVGRVDRRHRGEVDALQHLVDEFAQFAPSPSRPWKVR